MNTFFKNIVIIDANFILLPIQFKIDYLDFINTRLEGGTRFIVFKQIFDELEAKKMRDFKAIKFIKHLESGISYLDHNKEKYNIIVENQVKKLEETTDQFLLRKAIELKDEKLNVFLATNDKALRQDAKEAKVSTIFLRQKKYLSIEKS